jgi:hypothetical protein
MYLHLHDGPAPLDTAEDPLAPGAKPYLYRASYPVLGQAGDEIRLPDDLFKQSPAGFAEALKSLEKLYKDFASGKKVEPAKVAAKALKPLSEQNEGLSEPVTIAAILKILPVIIGALQTVLGNITAGLVNNQISQLYASNAYNVQNLNRMNLQQLTLQIEKLDQDVAMLKPLQFVRAMTLAQFRLVYQRRFDMISMGRGIFGALPGWLLPVGIGLGALLLLRRR